MKRIVAKILQNVTSVRPIYSVLTNCRNISVDNTNCFAGKTIVQRSFCSFEPNKCVYLVDDTDSDKVSDCKNVNKFTNRTHTCGELTAEHVGQQVTLYGWLEYLRLDKFIVLRDSYGETQLLINENVKINPQDLPYESILCVKGTVVGRPKSMINNKQSTGAIEVQVDELQLINKSHNTLPFNIREFQRAKEALRMQFRYLDIRFPQMQRNLRLRSALFMRLREFLIANHFVDVETPTLFGATPGGAQEFIVPTRFPGKFYSLVQSPQQFKQMLMAGALDRYFQIAKCYRDEGARSDRQPEFTQLDVELSFTTVEGVLSLIEELLVYALKGFSIPKKFPRLTYEEAVELYGSDKPDVSFGFKLENCTRQLNHLNTNNDSFGAYLIKFEATSVGEECPLTKTTKDALQKLVASHWGQVKLVQTKVNLDDWSNRMDKLLTKQVAEQLLTDFSIENQAVVFVAYGDKHEARSLLGKVRLEYVKLLEDQLKLKLRNDGLHFLWITDFPLLEFDRKTKTLQTVHHPFTTPHQDDLELLEENPLKVRSLAYDLVLNGNEVGGGSIRIHQPKLQERMLKLLGIPQSSLQHIIDMLGSGCPPHGGIALGLDRLLATILKTGTIRDVIAFPKNFDGKDPISQAPNVVCKDILDLYHIAVKDNNETQ